MALRQSVIPELEKRDPRAGDPVWAGAAVTSVRSHSPPLSLPRFTLEAERAPGSLWTPESSPSGTGSRRQFYFTMNGTCMQSTYTFDLEEAGR